MASRRTFIKLIKFQISYFLVQFDYFVCPIEYNEVSEALTMECNRSFVFQLQHYNIPQPIQYIGSIVSSIIFIFFFLLKHYFLNAKVKPVASSLAPKRLEDCQCLPIRAAFCFHVSFCIHNWAIWRVLC